MKTHTLLTGLATLSLLACQSIGYETPYDNPHVLPPQGTTIKLNQPLSFVPNNSRSTIQYGKPLGKGRLSRLNPWCQFYLYESQEQMKEPRTIEPDQFSVTKSFHSTDYGDSAFGGPIGRGSGTQTMKTTMRLRSDKQPQVYELRCGVDDDLYLQNWVTINQMIETLGGVATVTLPQTFKVAE